MSISCFHCVRRAFCTVDALLIVMQIDWWNMTTVLSIVLCGKIATDYNRILIVGNTHGYGCRRVIFNVKYVLLMVCLAAFRQAHIYCSNGFCLTHWDWVTHICVSKLTIIGSDNGLGPGRRQAIIWINAGMLLNGPLGTIFREILIEIHEL